MCPNCGRPVDACVCKKKPAAPQGDGTVRLLLEKKGRGGKTVTLVTGLTGNPDELRALAADLKRRCGTGGTLKDGVIEIQGDHRDTIAEALKARGMKVKKAGG